MTAQNETHQCDATAYITLSHLGLDDVLYNVILFTCHWPTNLQRELKISYYLYHFCQMAKNV